MDFKIIASRGEIEKLAREVLGHQDFPPFLFSDKKYTRLVVSMSKNNYPIGMAYGVVEYGSDVFFLHFLYIHKAFRNYDNIKALLEYVFQSAKENMGVTGAVWKFISSGNSADIDTHMQLLKDIPGCVVKDVQSTQQYRFKADSISHLRQFKIFNPSLCLEKGYQIIRLSLCDENLMKKLCTKEDTPFNNNDKNSIDIDEDNSHVFVRGDTQDPIGWIVCSVGARKEITIRHFFMYKSERAKIMAHSFASYVLDIIEHTFDYLAFDITKGNRQMEMIVKKYFVPMIDSKNIIYSLVVDFSQIT